MRAVRSVQRQTMDDYEHIIIDDGSRDETLDCVNGLEDRRVKLVSLGRNRGANFARNVGLEKAKSPLVTFLDSDDAFKSERLASVVTQFDQEPDLNVTISSFVTMRGGEARESINPSLFLSKELFEKALIYHAVCIAGSAISARLDTVRSAGGFTERLQRLQDRDFLLSVSQTTGVKLLSKVDWVKHESADSISVPLDGYVASFAALLTQHPHLKTDYPEFMKYHAARNIIKAVFKGRISTAMSEYQVNRSYADLDFSASELVRGYLRGKSLRRKFIQEMM